MSCGPLHPGPALPVAPLAMLAPAAAATATAIPEAITKRARIRRARRAPAGGICVTLSSPCPAMVSGSSRR